MVKQKNNKFISMLGNMNPFGGFGIRSKLFKNPMVMFIYGILSKWYLIGMVASITTTYWVFKGLKDIGLIDKAEVILIEALDEAQSIARFCTPKITNLQRFWDCFQNPPRAPKTKEEIDLFNTLSGKPVKGQQGSSNMQYKKQQTEGQVYYDAIKNSKRMSIKVQEDDEEDYNPYDFVDDYQTGGNSSE